ncbi:MAG: flagellar brake domain-containing protein [Bacillota bacterium]|nr:flagellar brake domain-containing protein [Bacillota bacterium]
MLSKYVVPGNKIEIQSVERAKYIDDTEKKKVYQTQVYDILSEDRLEIYMPIEKSKLILLPVNAEYDLYFYTPSGLYQCFANVIDRYKTDNQFILLMELTSNLRKFQRREYYRLSCALEMNSRPLEKEEIEAVEKKGNYLVPGLPLKRSVIVDISGGGIRFVGNYAYEPDSLVYCKYNLVIDGNSKEYTLVSKVLTVRELEDRRGIYEHRAQYINIDTAEREEIIRFIFEEERKNRKREKGL